MFGHSDSYHLTSTIYSLLREENGEIMKLILNQQKESIHSYACTNKQKQLILIVGCTKDWNYDLL